MYLIALRHCQSRWSSSLPRAGGKDASSDTTVSRSGRGASASLTFKWEQGPGWDAECAGEMSRHGVDRDHQIERAHDACVVERIVTT